jgi:hypothetical protein
MSILLRTVRYMRRGLRRVPKNDHRESQRQKRGIGMTKSTTTPPETRERFIRLGDRAFAPSQAPKADLS